MSKKWIITEPPPKEFLDEHPELPTIVAGLLWNRNLKTQKQIDEFLNPDYEQGVHDPWLFRDMTKAVEIVYTAIKNNERIVVHGDYDADGVCAATVLVTTLKTIGCENVDTFLPHRETDGYGLNERTVALLDEQDAEVIITCDCGISNTKEITLAKELGMQVIVTDHHAIPSILPPADAILHPLIEGETYPDKTLSGGGVAFKLAQALLLEHKKTSELLPDGQTHEGFEKWLLDCVAISTVADMVPLLGESRTLTRYGLTVLNKTRNRGLQKLLIVAGLADETGQSKRGAYSAQSISFQIAPRINAAGRMDHANVALKLLLSETDAEAEQLAEQLNRNNSDRQKLTEQLVREARKQLEDSKVSEQPVLFVLGDAWPTGILGLIAGKIKEEYGKPTIVLTRQEHEIVASGRSVTGFNMIATLQSMPEYFAKFGGHPMACGFSLKSKEVLDDFQRVLTKKARLATSDLDLTPQIQIDATVDLDEVNWKLYDLLEKFEPFGVANSEPLYAASGLTIMALEPVGADGKHLRLMVKHNSHVVRKTIAFGFGDPERHPADWKKTLKAGDKVDLAFTVGVNEWNGNRELQLQIEDIKKSAA